MRSLLVSFSILFSLTAWSHDSLDLGKHQLEISEFTEAKETFTGIIESHLSKEKQDSILAYSYVYRGKSNQLLEKYDFALNDYLRGQKLFRRIHHHNGEVFALVSIAEFYRNISEFDKSVEYLNQAKTLSESHEISIESLSYMYNRFAAIYSEIGIDLDKVKEYSNMVIELARESGDRNLEASSLNELGFLLEKNSDIKGLDYYRKSLRIYKEIDDQYNQCLVLRNLARFYAFDESLLDKAKAMELTNDAIKIADSTEWYSLKVTLYYIKHLSLVELGRYEEAISAMNHYANNLNLDLEHEKNKSLFEIEAKYRSSEKDNLILLAEKEKNLLNSKNNNKTTFLWFSVIISSLLAVLFIGSIFFYQKSNRSNKQLLGMVKQKEILVQEVHHRVKNNLTTLDSLLFLQAKASDSEEVRDELTECQSRVHSMALVHQNLYDVDDTSKVDLQSFIQQLLTESASIFNYSKKEFKTELATHEIYFDAGFTIFVGLVLNELVTNSFKYAFEKNGKNKISIEFRETPKHYFINYKDSGLGLGKNFNLKNSDGFGFKLISIMLNQINGEIDYNEESNTFLIKFKNGEKI